jgi:hypothetical protein
MRKVRSITVLAVVAGLAAAGATIPAGVASAAGGGGVTPPGPPTYTVTVQGHVSVGGDVSPGGFSETYQPPECWLQPYFRQPESFLTGDGYATGAPQSADSADTFWWDMATYYPAMEHLINFTNIGDESGRYLVNQDFKEVQQGQNDNGGGAVGSDWVWWAPNWLNTAAGLACAEGLAQTAGMNNGFLDLEPPGQPGVAGQPGEITGLQLAALARAALQLPTVTIHTQPGGGTDATSAYVNTPTKLYLTYAPTREPSDRARVDFLGETFLTATITTSAPTISIVTDDSGAAIDNNGTCLAGSKCSITFNGPTPTGDPYTITVTATWTVNWATSGGQAGTFTQPPATVTATRTIIVREIQSIN